MTDARTEAFVSALLARMTLEEKVGQVIQADIGSITPADLADFPLGSILAGGNSAPGGDERAPAMAWVELAREFRAAAAARPGARVPLMFGIDAVHGHNNVVGATLFPHNIGLGASRNPDLIRRIGRATALEVAATGADWTFGPTLAVPVRAQLLDLCRGGARGTRRVQGQLARASSPGPVSPLGRPGLRPRPSPFHVEHR
jgi:beta-glucosidase